MEEFVLIPFTLWKSLLDQNPQHKGPRDQSAMSHDPLNNQIGKSQHENQDFPQTSISNLSVVKRSRAKTQNAIKKNRTDWLNFRV